MQPRPKLTEDEERVLAIVSRGHPHRKVSIPSGNSQRELAALSDEEIEIAAAMADDRFMDAIARLVSRDFIASGRLLPGLWGRLKGQGETVYFWTTRAGEQYLAQERTTRQAHIISTPTHEDDAAADELRMVATTLARLGYRLTEYGAGAALASLASDYSYAETASYLALVALAMDTKEAGLNIEKLTVLMRRAGAMVDVLVGLEAIGEMRTQLFKNDARAMMSVVIVDADQEIWIERILSDPMVSRERVATYVGT